MAETGNKVMTAREAITRFVHDGDHVELPIRETGEHSRRPARFIAARMISSESRAPRTGCGAPVFFLLRPTFRDKGHTCAAY